MTSVAVSARDLPSGQLATLLIDLVVPVAGYYLLRAVGMGPVLALVLAGLPTAFFLTVRSVRRGKIDALGIFVLLLLAAGVAVSFVTGSPRFLLAKAGWLTAVVGIGFLATLFRARPLTFTLARAILHGTSMGRRFRTDTWDQRWGNDSEFRRVWRVCTVWWGAGLIVDAAVRVLMAYTLPVDVVPVLSAVAWVVTFVVLQIVQHVHLYRAGVWRSPVETVPHLSGQVIHQHDAKPVHLSNFDLGAS